MVFLKIIRYHRFLAAVGLLPIAWVVRRAGVGLVPPVGVVGDAVGLLVVVDGVDDGRGGGNVVGVGRCSEKEKVMNLHDTLTTPLNCCLNTF